MYYWSIKPDLLTFRHQTILLMNYDVHVSTLVIMTMTLNDYDSSHTEI